MQRRRLQLPSIMQTKQTITKKMDVPADKAWDAIRQFGRLDVWFPSMAECRIEGQGIGASRHLTLDGGLGNITDRLVAIDDDEHRLTYERLESPFPVTSYVGNVEVFASFDLQTVVVWTIDFESEPEASEAVAVLLSDAISAGLDGMETDLRAPD
jgi:Polyketide cyclase / dehydrase and lipid transport